MATGVVSGLTAVMLEANNAAALSALAGLPGHAARGKRTDYAGTAPLTANAVKAMLQYSATTLRDANGAPYDALTQGSGEVNGVGAVTLAYFADTTKAPGTYWLTAGVSESTHVRRRRRTLVAVGDLGHAPRHGQQPRRAQSGRLGRQHRLGHRRDGQHRLGHRQRGRQHRLGHDARRRQHRVGHEPVPRQRGLRRQHRLGHGDELGRQHRLGHRPAWACSTATTSSGARCSTARTTSCGEHWTTTTSCGGPRTRS